MTCNQEGVERPPCTLSSVVYESMCKKCNPKKGDLETQESEEPSLYVGETSRSIQERAQEHWGDAMLNVNLIVGYVVGGGGE